MLCNGSKGHHILSPEETVRTRAGEAAAVKKILGLTEYRIRDVEDGELEVTLANRRRLIRDIRAFAPDIVIGHRTNDYHADHRAAAQLLQDASYMLIVPHGCPGVPAMRQMPVINKQEYSAHCGDVLLAAEGARHGGTGRHVLRLGVYGICAVLSH